MDASQKIIDLLKTQFELQERFTPVLVDLSKEEKAELDVVKGAKVPFDSMSTDEKLSILSHNRQDGWVQR